MRLWIRLLIALFVAIVSAHTTQAAEKPSQKKVPLPLYQQQIGKMLRQFFKEQPKLASRSGLVGVNVLYQNHKDGRPVFWGILYNDFGAEDPYDGKVHSWFQPANGNHKLQSAWQFVTKQDRERSAKKTEKANNGGGIFLAYAIDPFAEGLVYPYLVDKLRDLPRLELQLRTNRNEARSTKDYPAFPVKITEQETVWVSVEQE